MIETLQKMWRFAFIPCSIYCIKILLDILIAIMIVPCLLLILMSNLRRSKRKNTIGIFHLYCSSGGGGERVLWHTVKTILETYPKYTIYIYTHKDVHDEPLRILCKARDLFKIDLISDTQAIERLKFVPLKFSSLIEAKRYHVLTLLRQNFMSIMLAFEAAYRVVPEVYMETTGFTYTLPVFKSLGCTVITYVHYPTISNDMIENVLTSSHASFNIRGIFVSIPYLRSLKLAYYRSLASRYGSAGQRANLVMVNSFWTRDHIEALWKIEPNVVYPPCDVESFKSLGLERFTKRPGRMNIISVGQFRPEKNHQLQIEAFHCFLRKTNCKDSTLTIFGGCRDKEDQKRVDYLKDLIGTLELNSKIKLVVNASFEELLEGVRDADVALHTMANEHFGIALVEFMAAGLITVAHRSGGPKTDIIDDTKDGFLASDLGDFSDKLVQISKLSPEECQSIRRNATKTSDQFSDLNFKSSLITLTMRYL